MMKQEFEDRVNVKVTNEEFEIVHEVYCYHPRYAVDQPKDRIAQDFKKFGIGFIEALMPATQRIIPMDRAMTDAAATASDKTYEKEQLKRELAELVRKMEIQIGEKAAEEAAAKANLEVVAQAWKEQCILEIDKLDKWLKR